MDYHFTIVDEIPISEFKAKCIAILERVRRTKKPIRITRFGKPVAEVVPPAPPKSCTTWLGSMKGRMEILGDISSLATSDEWDVPRTG